MEVIKDDGHFYGDEHIIACNYGFELKDGDENRTCKANKVWSGKMPICQGQSIPDSFILIIYSQKWIEISKLAKVNRLFHTIP